MIQAEQWFSKQSTKAMGKRFMEKVSAVTQACGHYCNLRSRSLVRNVRIRLSMPCMTGQMREIFRVHGGQAS